MIEEYWESIAAGVIGGVGVLLTGKISFFGGLISIERDKIDNRKGGGHNERASNRGYKRFLSKLVRHSILYKDKVHDLFVGYYIDYLKSERNIGVDLKNEKVQRFSKGIHITVKDRLLPLSMLTVFQDELPDFSSLSIDNKHYLNGDSTFRDDDCPVMDYMLSRYNDFSSELFDSMEQFWDDDKYPYIHFERYCRGKYLPVDLLKLIMGYMAPMQKEREVLIDKMNGPGFDRFKLLSSWADNFESSGIMRLLES